VLARLAIARKRNKQTREREESERTGGGGEGVPATLAVVGDVVDEGEVLVHRPGAAPELRPLLFLRSSVAVVAVDGDGGRACRGVGGRRGAAPATI
jgi:hypothetical protein